MDGQAMGNTGTGTWSGRYDRLRERIQGDPAKIEYH